MTQTQEPRTSIAMLWFVLSVATLACNTYGSDSTSESEEHHAPHGPHHISLLAGDTHVDGEGDNATLGLDYEFRVNALLGVGAVVERAFGEMDATTALFVADIHIWEGLCVQAGPGVEHASEEDIFVSRLGLLYEFEFKKYTLSPQLHWDYHDGAENAIVAGIAIGYSF